MDAIVEKSENLMEILVLSLSSNTKHLSCEKLKCAFDWTEYFEKVYEKVKGNSSACSQLDLKLKMRMIKKKIHLGEVLFGIETFKLSRSMLYHNFLTNPDFPPELLPHLATKRGCGEDCHVTENEQFLKDVVGVVHSRAIQYELEKLNSVVSGYHDDIKRPIEMDKSTLAALFLRKHIDAALTVPCGEHMLTDYIISAFQTVSPSVDDAVNVVLQSLQVTPDRRPCIQEDGIYFSCVISWLNSLSDVNRKMACLPRRSVLALVADYFEIYRMYIRALTAVGTSLCEKTLKTDIPSASGASVGENYRQAQMTFDELVIKFTDLLTHPTCDRVRLCTKQALSHLFTQHPPTSKWFLLREKIGW